MNFSEKLLRFGETMGRQRHLNAISSGMMMSLPFMVIGAFFLIFANPPINMDIVDLNTKNIMLQFLIKWKQFAIANNSYIVLPFTMTMGIIGVINSFTIAYSLASDTKQKPYMAGLISTVIFFMIAGQVKDNTLVMDFLGANGLFTAIIVALLSVEITEFIDQKIKIKLDKSIPSAIVVFLNSLLPLVFNILIIYGVNLIIIASTDHTFPEFITTLLSPIINIGNNLWGYIFILLFGNLLWILGIHGTSIIFPIIFSIGITNTGINADLLNSGQEPNMIMNLQMFRYYALGGAGNTLGLVILMIYSKVASMRTIGKLAFIPAICGINEPVIFGVPIVLNPVLAIPFVSMPAISIIIGYFAQKLGLVSLGYMVDPSFTPFFIQSYLSALDWRNIILGLLLVLVSIVVYMPFFRIYEKQLADLENNK
ncbi:MAG: PTS sugar transporter subunit IIC [Brevinema sp.]